MQRFPTFKQARNPGKASIWIYGHCENFKSFLRQAINLLSWFSQDDLMYRLLL